MQKKLFTTNQQEAKLHNYQQKAITYIKEKKKCALFLNMGFGKTLIALSAAKELIDEGKVTRILVIAPKAVGLSVWPGEIEKWSHLSSLTYAVAIGYQKARLTAIDAKANITIVNRDNVKWLKDLIEERDGKRNAIHYDMVIVDESTSFKSHSTQRFKAMKYISRQPKLEYAVIMTGTPSPNSLMDLWAQIYILDQGDRLGFSFHAFRTRYFFISDYHGFTYQLVPGAKNMIPKRIKDIAMSIDNETAGIEIDVPVNLVRTVELSEEHMKAYRRLETEFFLELDADNKINVTNAVAIHNKLQQYSNGAIYDNPLNPKLKQWHKLHDGKLDELEQIINENPNENIIVAYMFQHDLERLKERFPQGKKLDNPTVIKDFEEGRLQLAFAHPASVAHGMNFQYNCAMTVWFGIPWSLELYQQFNGRTYRQGQTRTVRRIHIVGKNTIDNRIVDALRHKAQTQEEVVSFIRQHYMEEYHNAA